MANKHLSAFAHPSVHLALKRALNDADSACVQLIQWGADPVYSGRAAERTELMNALIVCEELLRART